MLYGNHSAAHVGNHFGNKKGIETRRAVSLGKVIALFEESLQPADSRSPYYSDPFLVLRFEVQPGVLDCLSRGNQAELGVKIHLTHFLPVEIDSRVVVFHLASELRTELRRIETSNRTGATDALD